MTPPRVHDPLPTCVNGLAPLPEGYSATVLAGLDAVGAGALDGDRLAAIADHVST